MLLSLLFRSPPSCWRRGVIPVLLMSLGTAAGLSSVVAEGWYATELARDRFEDADWQSRWVLEGNADVVVQDGVLRIATAESEDVERAATLWWREALPENVLIEFTAAPHGPVEGNAANVNLLLHAREADGAPYRFGRSGRYGEYHTIPNYIVTLTGGFQDGWTRLRRNPGFHLLHEDPSVRSEVGETYRIHVMITAGRIRYWINSRLLHDERIPDPLSGGHFALRTWRSRIAWSDVRISELHPVIAPSEQAGVWLKSGFESGVHLDYDEPSRQRDRLRGRDEETGYDWSRDVPAEWAHFVNLVRNPRPGDYVRTVLETVPGRGGRPTRALRMETRGKDPALTSPGLLNRNEYSLFKPPYDQAYTRYWMKLQEDYLERCPRDHADSWRMFFEVKEPDSGVPRIRAEGNRHTGTNNYRMSCYIRRKPDGRLYWHVRGESPQPLREVDWEIFNDDVPVPTDRWFLVEVYFRHAEDGVFWLAIDGRQVAYRRGRTQHPTLPLPIHFWSPFKLYLGPDWLRDGPVYQWIDDVEFWPAPPADASPRDESQVNRSTFLPPIANQASASSPAPSP